MTLTSVSAIMRRLHHTIANEIEDQRRVSELLEHGVQSELFEGVDREERSCELDRVVSVSAVEDEGEFVLPRWEDEEPPAGLLSTLWYGGPHGAR